MAETSTPAKSEKSAEPKENTSVDSERQKDVTKDYRNNWNKIFGNK
ncbi:MAG: hypothetical protein HOL66_16535 [Rhodospirillaceae bacterium]|nr:hypothetical protein [Rhodospirillaceae bacterium]MBT6406476.1 hypothetical protein [Rhodospirillaceae bacterium]